jgi:ABC-2 type transport system permease protein
MTVIGQASPATARPSPLAQMTRVELTLFMRERAGAICGAGFPLLLLVVAGAIPSFKRAQAAYGGLTKLGVYVPVFATMSLAVLALVLLPATLVSYRERGVLRRLKTTPAGPVWVLSAQLIVTIGAAVATLMVLLVVARLGYGVPFPRQFGGWVVAALFTMATLLGMGLLVAAVAPTARAAPAIGAIVAYPLMFLCGLWLPIPSMPMTLQHIAHASPLGAAWEAFQNADLGRFPPGLSLLTMLAWGAVPGAAAAWFFRWQQAG